MRPPPEAGPVGDKMGEESLLDYPPEKREEGRRDRQRLWRERFSHLVQLQATSKAVQQGAMALLGPWPPDIYDSSEPQEQEEETIGEAVRSILDFPADFASLNEQDHTGGRLSSYPENLTLAEKTTFRVRRNLIEGERQREDLKIHAGEGMHLLQSALLPFAYGNTDAWISPVGAMLDHTNELVGDLKRAAQSESLSPKAKEIAKHAASSASMLSGETPRMAGRNLAVRLKVLHNDGPTFGGGLSLEDLVEREMPTAVGPVKGKSGGRLAFGHNQKYTNLFYLLRDNAKKKLHEIQPVKWQDFDTWAKQYQGFVRPTPWDKENRRQSRIVRILLAKNRNGVQLLPGPLAEF
eukprot:g17039.t1